MRRVGGGCTEGLTALPCLNCAHHVQLTSIQCCSRRIGAMWRQRPLAGAANARPARGMRRHAEKRPSLGAPIACDGQRARCMIDPPLDPRAHLQSVVMLHSTKWIARVCAECEIYADPGPERGRRFELAGPKPCGGGRGSASQGQGRCASGTSCSSPPGVLTSVTVQWGCRGATPAQAAPCAGTRLAMGAITSRAEPHAHASHHHPRP